MKVQAYHDSKKCHEQELSEFPIAYVFNNEQMNEALEKLGAELSECCTVLGIGDIVKKTDAPLLIAMLKRHVKDTHELLMSDKELAEEIFTYEMDNHEYAINYDGDADILACLNLDWDLIKTMDLEQAYENAKHKHFKHMEEHGVI